METSNNIILPSEEKNLKVYLYGATGLEEDFKGELVIDSPVLSLKLDTLPSTFTFTIPMKINGKTNPRISEIVIGSIIEVQSSINTVMQQNKMRFTITSAPRSVNESGIIGLSFTGKSLENELNNYNIVNWPGIQLVESYHKEKYEDLNEASSGSSKEFVLEFSNDNNLVNMNENSLRLLRYDYTVSRKTYSDFDGVIESKVIGGVSKPCNIMEVSMDYITSEDNTYYIGALKTTAENIFWDEAEDHKNLSDYEVPSSGINVDESFELITKLVPYEEMEVIQTSNFFYQEDKIKKVVYIGHIIGAGEEDFAKSLFVFIDTVSKVPLIYSYLKTNSLESQIYSYYYTAEKDEFGYILSFPDIQSDYSLPFFLDPSKNMGELIFTNSTNTLIFTSIATIKNAENLFVAFYRIKDGLELNAEGLTYIDATEDSDIIVSQSDADIGLYKYYTTDGLNAKEVLNNLFDYTNYSELSWLYDSENNSFTKKDLSDLEKNWTVQYSSDIDSSVYYSDLSIAGQTLLQAITTIMDKFNLVPIVDTINKVFYMFKRNINFQISNSFEYAKDTGLSLQSNQYIQSIQQQIENQNLTTVLTANGADNLTLDGMVANSNGEIEDYSYFLGSFEITNIEEVLFTPGTAIETANEDSLVLIEKEFATKLLLWNYIKKIAQYEIDGGLIIPYQNDTTEALRYGLSEYYTAIEEYSYKKAELIESNRKTCLSYYNYYLNTKNSNGEVHDNVLANNLSTADRFSPIGISFNTGSKYVFLEDDGINKVFKSDNIVVHENSIANEEAFGVKELPEIPFNLYKDIVPVYKDHRIILPTFGTDFNDITSFVYDLSYTGPLSKISVAIRLGETLEDYEAIFARIIGNLKVECVPSLFETGVEESAIQMSYSRSSNNTVYFTGSILEENRKNINKVKFNIGLDPSGDYTTPVGGVEFGTLLRQLSYRPLNYTLTFDSGYTGRYLFQYNLMYAKYLLSSEDLSTINNLPEEDQYSKENVWLYDNTEDFITFVKTQPQAYLNYRYKYLLNAIRKDNFAEYLTQYYSKFGSSLIGTAVNYSTIAAQQFDEADYKVLETIRKAKVYNNTNVSSSEYLYLLAKEEIKLVNKPSVSLNVSAIDIVELEDYNSPLYIGEIINIFYPELSIDIAAQIKTLDWSPQSNSLKLTISTLKNNENSSLNYRRSSLRRMRLKSEEDSLKTGSISASGSSSINSTTVYTETSAEETSGAFSKFGEYSISIDGDKISIINSAKEEIVIADKNGIKAGSLNGNIVVGQKTTIVSDKNSGAITLGEIDSETGEYGLEILGNNKNKLKMGDQTGISIENAKGDLVMNSDVDGNLTLTGKIYAEGGEFIGDVSAGNVTIGPSGITVVNENGEITFEADINGNIISKGDITGSAGAFGPILLDENGISSENFSINTDGTASFSGRIKASGGYFTGEVQAGNTIIGPAGIKSSDSNGDTTFEIDENGDAFFKGDLTASSGTFGPVVLDENGMEILSDNNEIAFKAGANGNIYFKGELVKITDTENGPTLENLILDDGTRTLDMETVLVDTNVGVLQFGISNDDNSQFHTQLKNGLTIRKFSEAELSVSYDFSWKDPDTGETVLGSLNGLNIVSGKRTDLYEEWLGHVNNANQTIMTLDPVSGDLKLKGELTATSGSFTGEVSVGSNLIIGPHNVDGETYSIHSPNFKIDEDGNATFGGTISQGTNFVISGENEVTFEDKATNFTVDITSGYKNLYYDENKQLASENLSAFYASVSGDGINLSSLDYTASYVWSSTNQLVADGDISHIEFIPTPASNVVDIVTIQDSAVKVVVQIRNLNGDLIASVEDTAYVRNIIFGELTYMNSLGQTGEKGIDGIDGKSVNIKGEAYLTSGVIEDYDSSSPATTLSYFENTITYITGSVEGDSYLVAGFLFVYVSDNELGYSLFKWSGAIQGPQGDPGLDGADGGPGIQGPGVVYRGLYESTETYYCNINRKDLVSFVVNGDTLYYITDEVGKNGFASWDLPTSNDWKSFGAKFSSVATDLILANDIFVSKTINIGADGANPIIALNGLDSTISINKLGETGSKFILESKATNTPYLYLGEVGVAPSEYIKMENGNLSILTDQFSLENGVAYFGGGLTVESINNTVNDHASSIGGLETLTSSHSSSIIANTDGIAATVTATNLIEGRVSTAENSIIVNTNGIALKVSKDNIVSEINLGNEGIKISANLITLVGNVDFVGIQSDVSGLSTNVSDLGDNVSDLDGNVSDLDDNISEIVTDLETGTKTRVTQINGGLITTGAIVSGSGKTYFNLDDVYTTYDNIIEAKDTYGNTKFKINKDGGVFFAGDITGSSGTFGTLGEVSLGTGGMITEKGDSKIVIDGGSIKATNNGNTIFEINSSGGATFSGTSSFATHAVNADIAANAGHATHAANADLATNAANADLATNATNADLATNATNADLATNATNAAKAALASEVNGKVRSGDAGGWTIDANSIFSGTKATINEYSIDGLTLHGGLNGSLSATEFKITESGEAYFKGDITGASGTFGKAKIGNFNDLLGSDDNFYIGNFEHFDNGVGTFYDVYSPGFSISKNSTSSSYRTVEMGTFQIYSEDSTTTLVTLGKVGTSDAFLSLGSAGLKLRTPYSRICKISTEHSSSTAIAFPDLTEDIFLFRSANESLSNTSDGIFGYTGTEFSPIPTGGISPVFLHAPHDSSLVLFGEKQVFITNEGRNNDSEAELKSRIREADKGICIKTFGSGYLGDIDINSSVSILMHSDSDTVVEAVSNMSIAAGKNVSIHAFGDEIVNPDGNYFGDVNIIADHDMFLSAGRGGSGHGGRIYVQGSDTGDYDKLWAQEGTGKDYSTKLIKKNIEIVDKSKIEEFLDKIDITSFNYKANNKDGLSLIIENEQAKDLPFKEALFSRRFGSTLYKDYNSIPDYLKEYVEQEDFTKNSDGSYEFNPWTYKTGSLAAMAVASAQMNYNTIKELKEKNQKLENDIREIKEALGLS